MFCGGDCNLNDDILTIYCLTYNHEKYIRKTLQGFVEQETKYKYKVIVHDDASTDRTRIIIEEFVKNYPDLFIPIYQRENLYSKGVNIFKEIIEPMIKTKYTAICEGDDYWCDKNKIELQINYLEKNVECSFCVHNTAFINENGKLIGKTFNAIRRNINLSTQDIITNIYFHTSSYMYRTELRKQMPKIFLAPEVEDYPLTLYLSLHGYIHYIDRVMSCYRVGSINSWSERILKNKNKAVIHNNSMILMLKRINNYTNYKYSKLFQQKIYYYVYNNILLEKKYWKVFLKKELFLYFFYRLLKNITNR